MTAPEKPTDGRPWALPFALAVVAVAALNFVRLLPATHALTAYVFGDPGWALAVDAMLADGMTPTRDFAYYYGLLGLLFNKGWFAAFGRTAAANTALIAVCNLVIALGLVRFARAVELPTTARWLLVAAVPVAVMPLTYPSPIHTYEAALLVHALAFQARGRFDVALVLAVVAVFVKPSLPAVYVLLLAGHILFGPRSERNSWRERTRELLPAAAVAIVLAGLLGAAFDWEPLARTLFPLAGAKAYSEEGFGFFFGIGRRFWLRPSVVYYLFGPAGFWLLATAVTLAGLPGLLRDRRDTRAVAILMCAALHLVFVCLLFGHELSWTYYSFLPVLGACGVLGRWESAGTCPRSVRDGLLLLALSAWFLPAGYGMMVWAANARAEATGGLFATPADAAAWGRVRERARTEHVLVLTPSGAGWVLFPEVNSVRSWVLMRAVATPAEVERVKGQIRTADVVVIHRDTASVFEDWPEFNRELVPFRGGEEAPEGNTALRVFRRRPPK